jgi:hypothetical protein
MLSELIRVSTIMRPNMTVSGRLENGFEHSINHRLKRLSYTRIFYCHAGTEVIAKLMASAGPTRVQSNDGRPRATDSDLTGG